MTSKPLQGMVALIAVVVISAFSLVQISKDLSWMSPHTRVIEDNHRLGTDFRKMTSSDRQRARGSKKSSAVSTIGPKTFVADRKGAIRIAFVTFSHLHDFSSFERYIFPALDTFLVNETYHVVLVESWKEKFYNVLCRTNSTHAIYCARVRPIFVDCPEEKFGESPCCKQEKGLLSLIDDKALGRFDFYIFMDDDNYLRTNHLRDFLEMLPPTERIVITAGPANANVPLGEAGYMKRKYRRYNCTTNNPNYTYPWGQPVIYPLVTLEYIINGLHAGGLVKQCNEFFVTHDAGNAILHWMFMIPELRLPYLRSPLNHDTRAFGCHGVAHLMAVHKAEKRRRGKVMAPGMREIHEKYSSMRFRASEYRWHNVTGFMHSKTFAKYGYPHTWKQWHTMPTMDCIMPSEFKQRL